MEDLLMQRDQHGRNILQLVAISNKSTDLSLLIFDLCTYLSINNHCILVEESGYVKNTIEKFDAETREVFKKNFHMDISTIYRLQGHEIRRSVKFANESMLFCNKFKRPFEISAEIAQEIFKKNFVDQIQDQLKNQKIDTDKNVKKL